MCAKKEFYYFVFSIYKNIAIKNYNKLKSKKSEFFGSDSYFEEYILKNFHEIKNADDNLLKNNKNSLQNFIQISSRKL